MLRRDERTALSILLALVVIPAFLIGWWLPGAQADQKAESDRLLGRVSR